MRRLDRIEAVALIECCVIGAAPIRSSQQDCRGNICGGVGDESTNQRSRKSGLRCFGGASKRSRSARDAVPIVDGVGVAVRTLLVMLVGSADAV